MSDRGAARSADPDCSPAATTPDDVRAWLAAFFLAMPEAPIYAAARGGAQWVDPDRSPSAFDWPALSAEVLGRGSRDRLFLLTWARCEAQRLARVHKLLVAPAGGSIRDFCREYGVPRSTFEASVRRSLSALAREWDRRRSPG